MNNEKTTCLSCQKTFTNLDGVVLKELNDELKQFILNKYPGKTEDDFICFHDLMNERLAYIQQMIQTDSEEMSELNEKVMSSIEKGGTVSANVNQTMEVKTTIGQRVADSIAKFGGSWGFIFIFLGILLLWIIINSIALFTKPFDPYPFILLNLVLSCLAAIQAPVIMMSQNRQEDRDRQKSDSDYQVNLKSEIEIRLLHEKMDHMLTKQWNHLIKIQNVQLDLLNELHEKIDGLDHEKGLSGKEE